MVTFILLLLAQTASPDDLIERLGNTSIEKRSRAQQALEALGPDALPALKRALLNADPETRGRAAELIWKIEWADSINPSLLRRYPELHRAWEMQSHDKILEQARDDRSFGSDWKVDPFEAYAIKLLDQPQIRFKKKALEIIEKSSAMTHRPPRRPVRLLLRALGEWDPEGWEDARRKDLGRLASCLFRLGTKRYLEDLKRLEPRHRDARRIARLIEPMWNPEAELSVLNTSLESGDRWLIEAALQVVRKLRHLPARPIVQRLMQERAATERDLGMTFIELVDEAYAKDLTKAFRKTPQSGRPWGWYKAIEKVKAREAIPFLIEDLTTNPNEIARGYAAQALGVLKAREAFPVFVEMARRDPKKKAFIHEASRLVAGNLSELVESTDPVLKAIGESAVSYSTHPKDVKWIVEQVESSPDARRRSRYLGILYGRYALLSNLKGSDKILARIARTPEDPLSVLAARILLKTDPARWTETAEQSLLAALTKFPSRKGNMYSNLMSELSRHPSARMVAPVKGLLGHPRLSRHAVFYLLWLDSPDSRAVLLDHARETENAPLRMEIASELARRGHVYPELIRDSDGAATARSGSTGWHLIEFNRLDVPGFRERLRKWVRAHGPFVFLPALEVWAHPEMLPQLKKVALNYERSAIEEANRPRLGHTSWMTLDLNDRHLPRAIAAAGDPGVLPFLLERLNGPQGTFQSELVPILGRMGAEEAIPHLKRLVNSGNATLRGTSLIALSEINGLGTYDYLMDHLDENPRTVAVALGRLGDPRGMQALWEMIEEGSFPRETLGALDFLANWKAYERLDRPFGVVRKGSLHRLPKLLERESGVTVLFSSEAQKELHPWGTTFEGRSPREVLASIYYRPDAITRGSLTHFHRNGRIEIMTVTEARALWKKPAAGEDK